MKLYAVIATCFLAKFSNAAASAQVLEIISRLNEINKLAQNLTVNINQWNFTNDTTTNIINSGPSITASDVLGKYINDSNTRISTFSELIETDTLRLEPPVNSLTHTVKLVIDAIIARKREIFATPGLPVIVQGVLAAQNGAATQLSNTIVNKVPADPNYPDDLRDVARILAAGIAENIQRGVNAFKCETCDSATGQSGTCNPNNTNDSCNDNAGSSVSALSSVASILLATVVAVFIVL